MLADIELPPLRSRAQNREFRRESLIRGAIVAVAQHDLAAATVDIICRHAGVSRGLIAHYFDSKEHLLSVASEALFIQAIGIKRAIVEDESLTAFQKLNRVAKSSFEPPIYDPVDMAAWQAFTNASRSQDIYKQPIADAGRDLRALFAPLFEQAAKDVGKSIDARQAAYGMTSLLDGLWSSLATAARLLIPGRA